MRTTCRQKMVEAGGPKFGQPGRPRRPGTAAVVAGTTSTEEEASWDAALKAGVHFVDVIKPATTLLIVALIMVCTPTMARAATRLDGAAVFSEGLTLCEPPIGGGRLMALPPMPDCHRSMGHPVDSVAMRLFVRRHKIHRGEIYAMHSPQLVSPDDDHS